MYNKSKDSKPKYVNCGEHTANYRSCAIVKELQNRRNITVKDKKLIRKVKNQIVKIHQENSKEILRKRFFF